MSVVELKQRIQGIFPAVPTPLTENEQVDTPALERLIEHLLSGGVHGLWMLGSGSEAPNLADEMRRQIIQVAVQVVRGRVPILVGTTALSTRQTITNTRQAADLGADGAFVLAPYYYTHSQEELRVHFEMVLQETDLPIMLYHNPYNTKLPIKLDLVEALSAHERLIGIKDSGGDFTYTQALLRRFQDRPDFRIFQGFETTVAATILLGGHGAVLGMPNLAPHLCVELYNAARQGDIAGAFALQARLTELLESLWSGLDSTDGLFIGGIKTGLSLLGICTPRTTRPFRPLTAEETQLLRGVMAGEGLL
jgi:4-hydroxy-tetrahydrodipicolinate synthase